VSIAIAVIMVAAGYLSGSVSYATLLTRGLVGKDIREMGNRNPGTLNVGKNLGKGWGILVAFLDALKSFLPMLVASLLLNTEDGRIVYLVAVATGMAAIVGHWKPVFHGFRGGQAVGSAIGVFLFAVPLEFLISFAVASLFGLLVMRRRDPAWVRWVPISLPVFVPFIATGLNAALDVPIVARISLGGHPWEWIVGVWAVCFLMLGINFRYIRTRVGGAAR
jgi:acyl-phosphate glycerol 3-phosphate acyltransferase